MIKLLAFLVVASILGSCHSIDDPYPDGAEITDKQFVTLGGVEQYVEIKSSSASNPVLLFIHGGPAWPQTPQLRYFNDELSEHYSLVIWEQRGAGKSFEKDSIPNILSLDQIVKDGHELTNWLKAKFNTKQIFLAGYSWGSLVGVELANQYPQDYIAYIGIAQLINMDIGMKISRTWLREQATLHNDTIAISQIDSLEIAENYDDKLDRFFKQWLLLNKYNGAVYLTESEAKVEKAMAYYKDYRDYDWFAVWEKSSKRLQGDMFGADIRNITSLQIPVFLLEGRHDWNIPSTLAEHWLITLEAPKKGLFWFEQSGHGPLEEEPEKFNQVMIDILTDINKPDAPSAIDHYICYTDNNSSSRKMWIGFTEDGKATQIKYFGQEESIDLAFTNEEYISGGAHPTIISNYDEWYEGRINGKYTLTHSGIWDYVTYVRGTDGKEFNFTIDHSADPYGKRPCF